MTFGVISLALTLGLGLVLGLQIRASVQSRSVREVQQTTSNAVVFTIRMMTVLGIDSDPGKPMTLKQAQANAKLFDAAANSLAHTNGVVGSEGVLADGTVIGGMGVAPLGSKIKMDDTVRAAFRGPTQTTILRRSDLSKATPVERALVHKYGDLLLLQQGARMSPTTPVLAVVRAYAVLGPAQRMAATDVRNALTVLGIGLLVFWAALFRLVLGASRAITRQSAVNEHLATHDALTGLPNRMLLRDRTEQAIAAGRRSGLHVAVLLADLDRFKEINDTLGHRHGDLLLQQIGTRLQEHLRDSDTIARLGGDEFVVLLPDLHSADQARQVAEKLVVALQCPFVIDGVAVDVGASIGIALTPDHGDDFDQLLQRADIAMYVAKQDSLGVVVFAAELDSHSTSRLTLLGELRRAVEQPEQIVLHYQPKAELPSGRISGVEALVRWQHPVHGLMPPGDFIPLAERTGIIRDLTWCILRSALEQNRTWAQEGLLLRVAVNVSARCLLDDDFPDGVARMLAETGVPADRLELELTESAIMSDPDRALGILRTLSASGVRLAIDDFGTGYSSMAYLKKLPVHEIKIDRTFVTGMAQDSSDAAIVRSSLELARNLRLDVVAEGVETADVWDMLGDLGCASAQGYFLSCPLTAEAFTGWLSARELSFADPLPV